MGAILVAAVEIATVEIVAAAAIGGGSWSSGRRLEEQPRAWKALAVRRRWEGGRM